MSERSQQAFEDWKKADALARVAELHLARAWENYFERHGSQLPERDLVREAARLRVLANNKLGAAMEALGCHPGDTTVPTKREARTHDHPA